MLRIRYKFIRSVTPPVRACRPSRGKILLPLLLCAAGLISHPASGLNQETQTWTTVRVRLPLGDSFDASARYRTRFSGFFDERRLYQYQATVGQSVSDRLRIDAGYELFRSRENTLEHRYFPQMQLRSDAWGLPLRHRLRLEIRDLALRDDTAYRLRYLIGHRRPVLDGRTYLEVRNEVFISLSEGVVLDRGFAQNRIGLTLGRRFGPRLRAELRYQWGYIDSDLVERGDNLIQFQLTWDGR